MFVLMLSYFVRVIDPNSSLGKIFLGEDVVVISSDKVEGSGDWNSPEFQDTANSGQKKAMVLYQMDTEEVSDRFVAPCFVNGLEAYDGEINLGVKENIISNEYAVKLCLEHEVKRGNKVVKKELIVALRGEIYFVKFIINPEEDDIEPGVIFGRSFLCLTKAITDFGARTVTIYPDIDPLFEETEEEGKSKDDWDHFLDFNIDYILLLGEEGLPPFVCKMGKSHLTQEEEAKEAIAIRMSRKFALLEEERPIIETMTYNDKYKKILDEVWKDKVELDGNIIKEEEEAVKRIKGEALKEKEDPGAFIFPIRLEGQVGVTTLTAKFLILDIPIDRDSPIVVGRRFLLTIEAIVNTLERLFSTFDGDDEEEYQIKRNKFGAPIYGPKPAPYLNCNDPDERLLAIQTVTNPFQKINVWKKAVSFLGSLPVPLKQVNWKPDYKGSYTKEEEATGQWRTKIRLTDLYGNVYLQGFTTKKTDRLWEQMMTRLDHYDPNAQDMKPWKRYCLHKFTMSSCYGEDVAEMLREAASNEEIFTSVAWIRDFNINEPIFSELCHEFYSTYEFDEVCADGEFQTKKIIKFRLGGRAHSLTLLEFAQRLRLYQAVELEEDGFNVYFEGAWVIARWMKRKGAGTQRESQICCGQFISKLARKCRVLTEMWYTNVAWLIAIWMKRKGAGTQKESQIYRGQFISKIARKCKVLTEDVVRSLSAPIYCRDLDTITIRDLIDSEGKLIPEDPQPGVPRVGIPRPLRASMQDLYDRIGRMEIRQEAIERMAYRQSYH
ncbi:hypothetical protein Tco_0373429 [Tanacetum coccineum]